MVSGASVGPAGGLLYAWYPESVWRAMTWVGSYGREIRVPGGSRGGTSVDR